MNCEACSAKLPDLLIGTVEESDRAEVENHLGTCEECGRAYERLQSAWSSIDRIAGTPSPRVTAGVQRLISAASGRAERTVRSVAYEAPPSLKQRLLARRGWLLPAAMAACALLAGFQLGLRSRAERPGPGLESRVEELNRTVLAVQLASADAGDRLAAIQRISAPGPDDGPTINTLFRSLEEDPSVNVRLAAVEALSRRLGEVAEVVRLARAASVETSPLVQIAIIQSLAELPHPDLRRAAGRALRSDALAPEASPLAAQLRSSLP